tara:strand:- start:7194 stop:7406 length:213 start_codon:yes stop_codon:yes gene_type:complete
MEQKEMQLNQLTPIELKRPSGLWFMVLTRLNVSQVKQKIDDEENVEFYRDGMWVDNMKFEDVRVKTNSDF